MDIFSLTYLSSASELYDPDVYREIALHSRTYNEGHAITGMLLVYNETIIQFLEGPESDVSALYRNIERDKRHKDPVIVSTRNLDKREFPEWSMGFQDASHLSDPKFLFGLSRETLHKYFPKDTSATSVALLSGFTRSSGLAIE